MLSKQGLAIGKLNQPGGNDAFWLGTSDRVVFRARRDRIMMLDVKTRQTTELLSSAPEVITSLAVSRDGRQIFVTRTANESDIWIATLNAPQH